MKIEPTLEALLLTESCTCGHLRGSHLGPHELREFVGACVVCGGARETIEPMRLFADRCRRFERAE